jgi:hypothetical protein
MGENITEAFTQLGEWAKEGEVKPVIQQIYEFENVPKACSVLREGRRQ